MGRRKIARHRYRRDSTLTWSSPSIYLGGYPGYYDRGYYGRSYYYPDTVVESPAVESYYEPQPVPSVESSAVTQIRVIKPSADASLWMDGRRMDGATDTHIFEFS